MSTSTLTSQQQRRRESLVRAYQTYYIFRTRQREKLGLKLITFLGIAVPLISGGLLLTTLSVWALVDKWDEKAQMAPQVVEKFRRLVSDLERLRVNSYGTYDEAELQNLEDQSYEGRRPDDVFDVSEPAKLRALKLAEEKFPPI